MEVNTNPRPVAAPSRRAAIGGKARSEAQITPARS
jgi:hypothetical protein